MNVALQASADEELDAAMKLSWKQLAPLVPWGDDYEGVAVDGREVLFARSYIWAAEAGGDILCEVVVYAGETRYDQGGRASGIIARPA